MLRPTGVCFYSMEPGEKIQHCQILYRGVPPGFAAMTTIKQAASLHCCKSLVGRTFNQGEIRRKPESHNDVYIESSITSCEISVGQYLIATGVAVKGIINGFC